MHIGICQHCGKEKELSEEEILCIRYHKRGGKTMLPTKLADQQDKLEKSGRYKADEPDEPDDEAEDQQVTTVSGVKIDKETGEVIYSPYKH